MNLVVFLCLSFVATTFAYYRESPYPRNGGKYTPRPELISLREFLTRIPDIADELELDPSLVEHIGDKYDEFKGGKLYFDQGTCIIREGKEGTDLFYLLSGKVEIYKTDKETNQKEWTKVIQKPFTFGEDAYLNKYRSASVCAKSHVQVLVIPYRVVRRFMALNKVVNQKFLEHLEGKADFHRKSKFYYP